MPRMCDDAEKEEALELQRFYEKERIKEERAEKRKESSRNIYEKTLDYVRDKGLTEKALENRGYHLRNNAGNVSVSKGGKRVGEIRMKRAVVIYTISDPEQIANALGFREFLSIYEIFYRQEPPAYAVKRGLTQRSNTLSGLIGRL